MESLDLQGKPGGLRGTGAVAQGQPRLTSACCWWAAGEASFLGPQPSSVKWG